jgi:phage-related minor tail protein
MTDDTSLENISDLPDTLDRLSVRTRELQTGANGFARAMTSAFASSVSGGKQFDDVLKSLALRLSDMSLKMALAPVTKGIAGGVNQLFQNLFSATGAAAASGTGAGAGAGIGTGTGTGTGTATTMAALGAIKPFAAGGVIGTPTYFPLAAGGVGLAGEAGPEAIMPLARGADGRLGVAMNGGGAAANIAIHIATPDADSFRRSESYLTGQIARAVARGQRSL